MSQPRDTMHASAVTDGERATDAVKIRPSELPVLDCSGHGCGCSVKREGPREHERGGRKRLRERREDERKKASQGDGGWHAHGGS